MTWRCGEVWMVLESRTAISLDLGWNSRISGSSLRNGNSRNHEYGAFEVLGKLDGGWPIAKSIRNIPITLAVLKLCTTLRMTPRTFQKCVEIVFNGSGIGHKSKRWSTSFSAILLKIVFDWPWSSPKLPQNLPPITKHVKKQKNNDN